MAKGKKDQFDYLYKIVVVGDGGVGKTSLLSSFTRNNPTSMYCSHYIAVTLTIGGKVIRAMIFDTDGQERFGCLPKSHYEGVTGAVLVYDLTNHRTFENIARWLTEINEHTDSSIAIVLVGNKRDLEHSRAVHQEEAIKCASVSKIPFMETSAVDTTNVEKAFVTIIKKVHEISTEKQRVNGCSVQ